MKIIYEKERRSFAEGPSGKIEDYERKLARIRLVEAGDYYLVVGAIDDYAYESIIMGYRMDSDKAIYKAIEDTVYIATHKDFDYLYTRCDEGSIIELD